MSNLAPTRCYLLPFAVRYPKPLRLRVQTVFLFLLGIALFFAVHLVRVFAPGMREAAIARLGEGGWKGIYSLVSLAALMLVGRGYSQAYGQTPLLYEVPDWGRVVPLVLMAAAFVLAVTSNGPTGRIRRAVGDPLLIATILWAFAHLFVRSDALHVILFGGFLVWAMVDLVSVRRRRAAGIAQGPALAAGATPWVADAIAVVVGLGLYVAFMVFLHQWLFGVSPIN